MKGFYISASGAIQGHHGPLVFFFPITFLKALISELSTQGSGKKWEGVNPEGARWEGTYKRGEMGKGRNGKGANSFGAK